MTNLAIGLFAATSFFLAAAPAVPDTKVPHRTDPIAVAIRKLQPALKPARAQQLARSFRNASVSCGVSWQLLVSIAFHESSLGLHKVNAATQDFGLMMINQKTSLRYGLAQDTLLTDDAYSLAAACRVLSDNRARYGSKLPYWIGLYRSGTRLGEARIRDNAKRYDRMVRSTAAQIGYLNGWHTENDQR